MVVLLHGIGRTRWSMLRLAVAFKRAGYRVLNFTYPSRTRPLEWLASAWLPHQLSEAGVRKAPQMHFVTHSMGGLLVRLWVRKCGAPANLGRVVMLGPPNAGSEAADYLSRFAIYRLALGPNGVRLGTGDSNLPRTLDHWPEGAGDVGIIAGDRSPNPLLAALLPSPSDGKVSVRATHVAGERDHITVPYSHTWLAWQPAPVQQTMHFVRHGRFCRD